MHIRRRLITIGALLVVLVAAGAAVWISRGRSLALPPQVQEAVQQTLVQLQLAQPTSRGLTAWGFIEADEVQLGPPIGGRLGAVDVAKGDDVAAGTPLFGLTTDLLDASIAAAEAEVTTAEAQLAQATAGARPEQVRQAEAAVQEAEAAQEGAHVAWQDAQAMLENPQELDLEIVQARAEVASAQAAVAQAEADKDAATIANDNFNDANKKIQDALDAWSKIPEDQRPPRPVIETQLDFHLIPNAYWQAWVALNTASAQLDGAKAELSDLLAMRADPHSLQQQVDAAKARYEESVASTDQARAQLAALKAGATDARIAVLTAQVEEARAGVATLQQQKSQGVVAAPVGGLILDISRHAGELVAPGATVLTLGNLDDVKLTVYVRQDELGRVQLGQPVEVRADSAPDAVFTGQVVSISSNAEYTPRNVQTQEERVSLVFGVDVRIPNPDHVLKPGTYAQATILTEGN